MGSSKPFQDVSDVNQEPIKSKGGKEKMKYEDNKQKQEYLEFFDKVFGTDTKRYINLEKVPLLAVIYDTLREDLLTLSDKYKGLRNARLEVHDAMQEKMTKEQKDLLETYSDLSEDMENEMAQQVFMFGVILANELNRECKEVSTSKE